MNDRFDPMKLARIAAFVSVAALVVLSVLPGDERPHVMASGNLEHVVAYAGTAFLITAGFATRWGPVVALSLVSALLEVAQLWIPGRSTGFDNWAASTAGAIIGAVAAMVLVRLVLRRSE